MQNTEDLFKIEKPRDKFLKNGIDALSKTDLLALLLGSGTQGKDVLKLSEEIIKKFDKHFLYVTFEELIKIKGIGKAKALQILAAIELVKRYNNEITKYNLKNILQNNFQMHNASFITESIQGSLFELLESKQNINFKTEKLSQEFKFFLPTTNNHYLQINNRRYIGSKNKLVDWIFTIINQHCKGNVFVDIFAGTGIISAIAAKYFNKIIVNDFLYSNFIIYQAFLSKGNWDLIKINSIIRHYNNINSDELEDNYFSVNFGGKYFSHNSAKKVGFIRENIELNKDNLTYKEYCILLTSIIYSLDKIANTVGHYDAYFKKDRVVDNFFLKVIEPINVKDIEIFQEDANILSKKITADIVYIDPPYNSRQYSRFYHVLETLTKWDKPNLSGVALKPPVENMSDYCTVNAKNKLEELVKDINAKYLVVSYNNTYESKSNSSKNKITLEDIEKILSKRGKTIVYEKDYRHFNAGNTEFNNHKEYLFINERLQS